MGDTKPSSSASRRSSARRVARTDVTSFDVAKRAGVSQSTVARAFARPALVSDATRERVHLAARELGYVPNAIAGGMRNQRSGLVGVVVPAAGEYWQSVISEFARQVGDGARQLLVTTFRDGQAVDHAIENISRYRLDGLVLASSTIGTRQISRLGQSMQPVVAFNQPAAAGIAPLVTVDNQGGAAKIAQHLIDRGIRNAIFVGGVSSASTEQLRYRGASGEFGARGIALPYVEAGAFTYDAGFKVGANLAEVGRVPDALVVAADEVAFGVIDGLRRHGVDVPGDVLVTGFDGVPQSAWEGYGLTTLVQPIELLVASALDLLAAHSTDQIITIEGELRLASTTRREIDHG